MEKTLYILESKINSVNKLSQVEVVLFDKNNGIFSFKSSLMSKYNAEKYQDEILQLLDNCNWFDVKYGVKVNNVEPIYDDEKKNIVALCLDKGMLLKNQINVYSR